MARTSDAAFFGSRIGLQEAVSPTKHARKQSHGDGSANGTSLEFLRDTSPSTALRIFTDSASSDLADDEEEASLCSNIHAATAAEKALGVRVAEAAAKLRAWCAEIEQWGWAGTFEPPEGEEHGNSQKSTGSHANGKQARNGAANTTVGLRYWGSLPSTQVEAYEERLRDIALQLEDLELDELKDLVLQMHGQNRSRPSSSYSEKHPALTLLDDVSLLITKTLLQALPNLSQLNQLMDTWTVRLAVLREVPGYLKELKTSRTALQLAWDAMRAPADANNTGDSSTRWAEALQSIRTVLQDKVGGLGERLDRMLDQLEGREDTIPDAWIDNFEGLEADYAKWAVVSQRRVLEVQMKVASEQRKKPTVDSLDGTDRPSLLSNDSVARVPSIELVHPSPIGTLTNGFFESATQFEASDERHAINSLMNSHVGDRRASPATTPSQPERRGSPLSENVISSDLPRSPTTRSNLTPNFATQPLTMSSFGENTSGTPSWLPSLHRPVETMMKRASITSIESIPRSQVKSVTIRRTSSTSSACSLPQHQSVRDRDTQGSDYGIDTSENNLERRRSSASQYHQASQASAERLESYLMRRSSTSSHRSGMMRDEPSFPSPVQEFSVYDDEYEDSASSGTIGTIEDELFPSAAQSQSPRPQTPESIPSSPAFSTTSSATASPPSTPSRHVEESPTIRQVTNRQVARMPHPPLNSAMAKRRRKEDPRPQWPPQRPSQACLDADELIADDQAQSSPASNAEPVLDLEQQIHRIITLIRAPIRLMSGAEAEPLDENSPRAASYSRPSSPPSAARPSKQPSLTLSPVKNEDARGARRHGDPDSEIRLYHLTQAGKDKPIKLFIRRVGENGERLMVRVGGGWADLGEYLRQYAEHHGRRTVSEGRLELHGLPTPGTPGVGTPTMPSGIGARIAKFSSPSGLAPTYTPPPLPNGVMGFAPAGRASTEHVSSTPKSPAFPASEPSTAGSGRTGSRGQDVGLGGLSARKLDLSGEKLEWVEGMMDKARRLDGGSGGGFRDLGKAGSTRRVFLKGE
ncbi:hypothetical protein H2201_004312 [Coniosporium apollinis]|uniref:GAR domain-containing protein n=1 Tax=Coniosporium apollinis TaxID=61459 RepID=A0ABQ9NWB4_9PEZI|nr:hypothetical protein H2201_004312 [Coniosporium apollinis]